MFYAAVAVPRTAPDPESPPPPPEAGAEDPTPPPPAVKPRSLPALPERRWKAVEDEVVGRREEVAAPVVTTGGGELSPLSTTTGQFALVLVVVGVVGGAMAAWTLRTTRR